MAFAAPWYVLPALPPSLSLKSEGSLLTVGRDKTAVTSLSSKEKGAAPARATVRRTQGIPRSQLQRVSGPDVRNAMLHRDGLYYVIKGTLSKGELEQDALVLAARKAALTSQASKEPSTESCKDSCTPTAVGKSSDVVALTEGARRDPRRALMSNGTGDSSSGAETKPDSTGTSPGLSPDKAVKEELRESADVSKAASQAPTDRASHTAKASAKTRRAKTGKAKKGNKVKSSKRKKKDPALLKEEADQGWGIPLPSEVKGILYPGNKITAQDYVGSWLPAAVVAVDKVKGSVLIHFERWHRRFDEWIAVAANRLKPRDEAAEAADRAARKAAKRRASEVENLKFDHPGKRSSCPEVSCWGVGCCPAYAPFSLGWHGYTHCLLFFISHLYQTYSV